MYCTIVLLHPDRRVRIKKNKKYYGYTSFRNHSHHCGIVALLLQIADDPILVAQVNRESANTRALVASSLLEAHVQATYEKDASEAIPALGAQYGPNMQYFLSTFLG